MQSIVISLLRELIEVCIALNTLESTTLLGESGIRDKSIQMAAEKQKKAAEAHSLQTTRI